jgi:type VI secretion system secreted protein Hcp
MNKHLIAGLVAAATALVAAPMAHADDYFLKINNTTPGVAPISGDQVVGKVNDAIQIKSFDLGTENKTTIGSTTGGAGTGKASFDELTITKDVDATSPLLYKQMAMGQNISSMELIARKTGPNGTAPIYQRYYFNMSFITSQKQSGDNEGIQETITFAYGAMQMTSVKQTSVGAPPTNVFSSWSVVLNNSTLGTGTGAAPGAGITLF